MNDLINNLTIINYLLLLLI